MSEWAFDIPLLFFFCVCSKIYVDHYDNERVSHQIKYLGLLENVRVRRAGFAFRMDYVRFLNRYVRILFHFDMLWCTVGKDERKVAVRNSRFSTLSLVFFDGNFVCILNGMKSGNTDSSIPQWVASELNWHLDLFAQHSTNMTINYTYCCVFARAFRYKMICKDTWPLFNGGERDGTDVIVRSTSTEFLSGLFFLVSGNSRAFSETVGRKPHACMMLLRGLPLHAACEISHLEALDCVEYHSGAFQDSFHDTKSWGSRFRKLIRGRS